MKSPSLLPKRLDWPSAIGNFLLNFGTVDYLVFVFLKDHLSEDEFAKVRTWHFKDRVQRIAGCLREDGRPADELQALDRFVEDLEPVRELRNHIAHGHMYCRIDSTDPETAVTILKAKDADSESPDDAGHVTFKELLAGLKKLDQLIQTMAQFNESHRSARIIRVEMLQRRRRKELPPDQSKSS